MLNGAAPTSQKSGDKTITFILDNRGLISDPLHLPIRPEDLTRQDGLRATVHQTQGREISGWVDNFGPQLPTCTIAGNTGWRVAQGTGLDGLQSFVVLNDLIMKHYPESKQAAIDEGADPALVKLLFIDSLDGFAWEVVPTQFVLRRSRSRPLLFQYNITLQALRTTIDDVGTDEPDDGDVQTGLDSLGDSIDAIKDATLDDLLGIPGGLANDFKDYTTGVFDDAVGAVKSGGSGGVIDYARDVAKAGTNVFRTLSNDASRSTAMFLSSAYGNVSAVLSNSLNITAPYEDYTDVYGASNCSSTTFGRPPSKYAGQNIFGLMNGDPVSGVSSAVSQSIAALKNSDPVLAPLSVSEIERHLAAIVGGEA